MAIVNRTPHLKFLEKLFARHAPATDRIQGVSQRNARINATINDALASAGLTDASRDGVSHLINDALARAGLRAPSPAPAVSQMPAATRSNVELQATGTDGAPPGGARGQFLARSFASNAGSLAYKVYLPAGYEADTSRTFPLMVMLHGCTQSPDDFAAGTRLNELADAQGFLVAYPAQSTHANGSKCWNWFRPQDQMSGKGEPALIAGITAQITSDYRVDPSRTYVAGLSAGAAMAVILGRTYPDVFAAIGVHSGLPYHAARDVGSAFAVMQSGAASTHAATSPAHKPVPTIVFHGDHDHTVVPANGDVVIAQVLAATKGAVVETQDSGHVDGGRRYTRTNYATADGQTIAEAWKVHGGGHAWMGGSATGTYTDPQGPNASVAMLRFFSQHALAQADQR